MAGELFVSLRGQLQAKADGPAAAIAASVPGTSSECQVAVCTAPCQIPLSEPQMYNGLHRVRLVLQMCCAILIKLLLDTWICAGAATAFPIALLVLSRAAGSAAVAARVRAYDLLLNLSAHAELLHSASAEQLLGSSEEPQRSAGADTDAAPVHDQAGSHASNGDVTQEGIDLEHWLHHLLLRLLEHSLKVPSDMQVHCLVLDMSLGCPVPCHRHVLHGQHSIVCQANEEADEVWAAAAACVLHFCSFDGAITEPSARSITLPVVIELLRCSMRCSWYDNIHQLTISAYAIPLLRTPSKACRTLMTLVLRTGRRRCSHTLCAFWFGSCITSRKV